MSKAMKSTKTEEFWKEYLSSMDTSSLDYDVVVFGDSKEMANELANLVLSGIKRGTTCLLRDVVNKKEGIPLIGGNVVLVDSEGKPKAIWRTIELRLGPMDSVISDFAYDEGEGKRTREDWLDGHRKYFQRQATAEGWIMHDKIEVIFERFEVVWPVDNL